MSAQTNNNVLSDDQPIVWLKKFNLRGGAEHEIRHVHDEYGRFALYWADRERIRNLLDWSAKAEELGLKLTDEDYSEDFRSVDLSFEQEDQFRELHHPGLFEEYSDDVALAVSDARFGAPQIGHQTASNLKVTGEETAQPTIDKDGLSLTGGLGGLNVESVGVGRGDLVCGLLYYLDSGELRQFLHDLIDQWSQDEDRRWPFVALVLFLAREGLEADLGEEPSRNLTADLLPDDLNRIEEVASSHSESFPGIRELVEDVRPSVSTSER